MAIVEDIPPSVPRCVGGKCGSRATEYFLGLPMVYNQNSKLTLISKCQTTVYRNILPVYGTFDEKSAIEGILEAQNQEADTVAVTVYLFLAKITCLS